MFSNRITIIKIAAINRAKKIIKLEENLAIKY